MPAISQEMGLAYSTVYAWVSAYEKKGLGGLRRPASRTRRVAGTSTADVCALLRVMRDAYARVYIPEPTAYVMVDGLRIFYQERVHETRKGLLQEIDQMIIRLEEKGVQAVEKTNLKVVEWQARA